MKNKYYIVTEVGEGDMDTVIVSYNKQDDRHKKLIQESITNIYNVADAVMNPQFITEPLPFTGTISNSLYVSTNYG